MSGPLLSPPNPKASAHQWFDNTAFYPNQTLPQVVAYPLQGVLCSIPRHQPGCSVPKKHGTTSPSNPFHLEGRPSITSSMIPPCWQSSPSVIPPGTPNSSLDKLSNQL